MVAVEAYPTTNMPETTGAVVVTAVAAAVSLAAVAGVEEG